jgi:hypothetical protein
MKILITALVLALFLVGLPQAARASEAEIGVGTRIVTHANNFVPAAAAAIVPTAHLMIDQLSSSDFVTTERTGEGTSSNNAKWHRQWAISLAPLFASQALDSASSYGMQELNPLLASPNGSFGMKATTLKFGVIGALAATETFVVRKYPRAAKVFTIVNWTAAGATGALAIHNYSLH